MAAATSRSTAFTAVERSLARPTADALTSRSQFDADGVGGQLVAQAQPRVDDASPAPVAGPMVRLEAVTKSFGDLLVLDGIDLTVDQGEVLVVIGASERGKSTLLRCVNLLEPVDSGRIFLEGKEITAKRTDVSAVRQRIGIVFQQFNLFPHLRA